LRDCEISAKFKFIFRKKFYLSRKISVPKFATSQSHETLCLTLKEDSANIKQTDERQNANASAKSKELHPTAKSQRFAAHLLLLQPHQNK
jgi:hypothetical protein